MQQNSTKEKISMTDCSSGLLSVSCTFGRARATWLGEDTEAGEREAI
jgi:hypothetical protein